MPVNMTSGAAGGPLLERTWKVRATPRAIDDAMRFADLAIVYCDEECRRATLMAVAELSENLLKYAAPANGAEAGTIAISVRSDLVRLRAANVAERAEDVRQVRDMIARFSSTNVAELYRQRLAELLKNPQLPRAQLGLLRIAFEGGFRLSCSYKPPCLEIVAERGCTGQS